MNTSAPVTNTMALISLVLGILSWIALPFIGAIGAVVCGHLARSEIRRSPPGTFEGDGMALAGLILGYLHLMLVLCAILFVFVFLGGLAFLAHFH